MSLTPPTVTTETHDNASLQSIVASICEAHGVELVDVRFLRMPGGALLRVLIDRPPANGSAEVQKGSGISVNDCTDVSRAISAKLDEDENLISGTYHLEVSSPGLERPLVKLQDFVRFAGREVKVQTQKPVGDRRNFTGSLVGVEGNAIKINQGTEEFVIPHADITKAHLVHRF